MNTRKRNILIVSLAIVGICLQTVSLVLLTYGTYLLNLLPKGDIFLTYGGTWEVYVTFTFLVNSAVFFMYIWYLFFKYSKTLQRNNYYLFWLLCYFMVVFVVVGAVFFPAILMNNSILVNAPDAKTEPVLNWMQMIFPHLPSPLFFLCFALIVFNVNKTGNFKLMQWGFWKSLIVIATVFFAYLLFLVGLNYVPNGVYARTIYHIGNKTEVSANFDKIYPGISIYDSFTDVNPKSPLFNNGVIWKWGSYTNYGWYILALVILFGVYSLNYFIVKKHFYPYKYLQRIVSLTHWRLQSVYLLLPADL